MNSTTSRSSSFLLALGVLAACGGGGGGGGPTTSTLSGEVRVPSVAPATLAIDAVDQPMQPGEVVVWLQPGTAPENLADSGFELVRAGGPIAVYRAHAAAGRASLHHGAPIDVSAERATVDATAAMRQKPGVRVASPNYMLKASVEPNDQFYPAQWHYPQINLPQAWSITQGSANVIVAVLDTGIASGHPDFDPARFVDGYDMISDPTAAGDGGGRDANPEDDGDFETPQGSSFHGTHVAGTIGARSNNSVGVAGVDWNCKLMIVRVLGRGGGSVDDIANGILYAAGLANGSGVVPAQRADVVNMSLGGPGLNAVLEQACDAAANAGTLLVAAAGNDNSANPSSPAAFSSVLSVGAVDLVRARAPYSNFSTTIDVWAPGGDMSADLNGDTYADGVLSCSANDQGQFFYQFENGTSMASPHVAGVAALVKATNPSLTAAQIRAILIGNATTQAGSGLPNGGRILDALLAVQAAGGSASGPLLVASSNNVDFGNSTTTLTITLNNLGTSNLVFDSSSTLPAWLGGTVTEAITGNGVTDDTFEFVVDRTGLANDVYQTVVTLTYLDNVTPVTIDITVRMQVGASSTTSDTIFLLLVDPITLETLYQTSTASGAGFAFSFAGVAAGNYLLVGGTDRDNDDFLGDPGELFGAWPDLDDPQTISVLRGVNSAELDFGMQDLVTVQSAGALASRSFRRLR
jgi:serine protease